MKELRVLIQQKDENGEFRTIKENEDIVGEIFDDGKPFALITGSTSAMTSAAGALLGYASGREEVMSQTKITKVGDSNA